MGYTGQVQIGYEAKTYFAHMNNGGRAFLEIICMGQILFSFVFMHYFLH